MEQDTAIIGESILLALFWFCLFWFCFVRKIAQHSWPQSGMTWRDFRPIEGARRLQEDIVSVASQIARIVLAIAGLAIGLSLFFVLMKLVNASPLFAALVFAAVAWAIFEERLKLQETRRRLNL